MERLKDCIRAREELISGLREDINMRQEKESSYREKVAELYSEIEKSQVGKEVKDVIDFSDSFVSGLEEQLNVAQRILKIKEEEIAGLNKKVDELTTRPMTPTSPAPRHDSYVESTVKELNQRINELNKQLVDERENSIHLQMTVDDLNCQISALQKEVSEKTEDINRIEKEYEAEMLNMSTNFKDQKALNCEELGQLTVNVEDLRSEIKDLERDNMYLREKNERVNQEHSALVAQLENEADGEGVELHAIQAKCNLKEQQLNNALSEIEVIRETLQGKCDALNELETTLSEQREVNVDLQNLINELKDRCEVLAEKETKYQEEITGLVNTIKGYEADNDELRASLTAANQKQAMQDSHIQHSIRDLGSALQELKLSKESLKVDVQSDLNDIAAQWSECVEEIRRQALQMSSVSDNDAVVNSKISIVLSSIKKLQQNYLSIKSEVETLLHCDVSTIFPELKTELDKIVELSSQKDERIKSLEQEVQKFKTAGKKIIDKLKKQLKDKDLVLKKMASESGNTAVLALQETNASLTKQISTLERDNEQLSNDVSSLKEKSLLETSLLETSNSEKFNSISSDVENFIHQYESVYQCQLIDNDFDICVFSTVSSRMINIAQSNVDQIQDMKSKQDESESRVTELSKELEDLKKTCESLTDENRNMKEEQACLQRNLAEVLDITSSKDKEIEQLIEEVSSLRDLQSSVLSKDEEISKLQDDLTSLKDDLTTAHQSLTNLNSQESNRISTLQREVEELEEKSKDLQLKVEEWEEKNKDLLWEISNLTESLDCKQLELKKLADKLELLARDCEDKDSSISELSAKCEDLEHTVDTLSSQVSYLAEEKDNLEKSVLEKESELERSLSVSPPSADADNLKAALTAKTNECKKFMAMIKKLKMIKEEGEKKCSSLEAQLAELKEELSNTQDKLQNLQQPKEPEASPIQCVEMTVEEIPEISVAVQSAVHAEVESASVDSPAITDTNSSHVHSSHSNHVTAPREPDSQSAEIIAAQEEKIESLQAEVVHLYNELRLFEDSTVSKDESIATLSEQLALSRQLLNETKQECEARLTEIQSEKAEYDELVKRMQKEKEEWLEKEKQLKSQANLTEAETVRLMSDRPPVQDQDAMSEVSHTSMMSHDTSFMSVSSIHRDMPCDVESLQAELMKKNKLAFLIKTKAKKLESRVKDAKREADKSRAHDRVKEKIGAIETELSNITVQLRNLSSGKKIESQTVKIDPKYVEEIESKLKHNSEQYEQIMIEYQNELRMKEDAVEEIEHLNHTLQDLEDQMQVLQEDLRNKDALLCEHINAAAEDEARNDAIREKFTQQNDELGHLRDLNKKMKEALIEMTDESARIEQTYKSTMHELEDEADQYKCDNATLSNELTNCWAKIEDLEEQNQNYMNLLENAHRQLREQSSAGSALESIKHQADTLTEQLNQYANVNQQLTEKLSVSEREKGEVINQLIELKQMYDEGMESKSIISAEKDKLLALTAELESKIKESEITLQQEIESSSRTKSELESYKTQVESLKEANTELLSQLESANSSSDSLKSTLSSKLKHLQEEHSALQNQLEESQFAAESLQEQVNIATEEKTKTSTQLEKVYNQLNDVLSDHEGCPSTIASLENRCASLEKEIASSNDLIESLKEEQNVIMESNMEMVRERDSEIERLNQVCQDGSVVEETLTSVNLALQSLKEEKEKLELDLAQKTQVEHSLKAELEDHRNVIETLKQDLEEAATALSATKAELESEKSDKDTTVQSLTCTLEETKVSLNDLLSSKSSELEIAITKKDELETELSASQTTITDLQKEIVNLKSEASATSQDLSTRRQELESELEATQKAKEELEKQVEELTAANREHAEKLHEAGYHLEQWGYYNEGQQQIITDLQTQLASLSEESTSKATEAKDKIGELTQNLEQLSAEKIALDDRLSVLQDENANNETKMKSLSSEIESITEEKKELEQKMADLIEKEFTFNKDLEDTNQKLKTALETQANLENQLSESHSQLSSVTEEKEKIDAENAELRAAAEALNSLSNEEVEQLKLQVDEKEKHIQQINLELEETKSLVEEGAKRCKALEEKMNEFDALQSTLSEKENTVQSLEQQLDDAYAGNEEAIGVLKTEIETLKEDNSKLTKENQRLLDGKDVFEEGLTKLQDSLEESKSTIVRYEQMLADWTQYGEQRETYLSSLNEQLAENERAKEELQSAVEKVNQTSTEMSQKCESLEENLKTALSNLTKATEEKEAISKKTKGIMKAYKETKIQIEKLKKEAHDKGNELSEQLQAQINELTIAQATLKEQNDRLSTERDDLMSEVENFEVEREFMTTLKDENTALKQSILEQSQRMDDLQSALNNTTAVEAQLISFREAKESADNQLIQCSDRIAVLEKDCSEKDAAIGDLVSKTEKLEHLERDCSEKEAIIKDLTTRHDTASNDLKAKLSEIGIKDAEINELRSSHVQLNRIFEDLGLDIENIGEVLPKMLSDANVTSSKLDTLQSQVQSFIGSIIEKNFVDNDIAQQELPQQFSAIAEKLVELSKSLQLSDAEVNTLRNQTVNLKEEANLLKSVKESLDNTDKTNEELQRKIEFLERDRSQHEHTVELLHQKFEENYQELSSAKGSLAKKETELTDVTNQFQSTISNLALKEQKIKELELLLVEKDSEKAKIQQNFDGQIKHFHQSSADLQSELQNRERELESLRADKMGHEEDLKLKSDKIASLLEEMDGYKAQILTLTTDLASLQQEYETISGKLRVTESEYESVSEVLSNKDSIIYHMEEEMTSLKRRLDAANSPDKDEELLNAIRQKDDVIEELRSELDSLHRDNAAVNAQKTELSNEVKTLQNNLESVRAELDSKDQNVGILYGQINEINERLQQTNDTNLVLKSEMETVASEMLDTKQQMEALSAHKEKIEAKMGELLTEKQDLQTLCESLKDTVQQLENKNQELAADLSKSNLDRNVLQKSVSEQNKVDTEVLLTKIASLEELNKTLEQSLLNSEENIGETTANYEQKCMEMTSLERELSAKKEQIHTLEEKLVQAEGNLTEKSNVISRLESDFTKLVSSNADLEKKLDNFSSQETKDANSKISTLKVDLEQALVDNQMLRDNNTMLVSNNTQLTENYKQLHDSVAVFQQRDTYLNEMCQKLQSHTSSLEAHSKTITEEFTKKVGVLEEEKSRLKEQLASYKSGSAVAPQVSDLKDELSHMKNSKEKLVSEVEAYQARLQVATSRADSLEKSHQDLTSRYNTQCGLVEKKTADLAKVMKQYKAIKQKLVNELNTRKSLVQETINGKEKVAIQFGEKSKRLKVSKST